MINVNYDESGVRIDCDGDIQLQVFIKTDKGTFKYGFSLNGVDKTYHQLMFKIVERQIKEIHKKGIEQGRREVRNLLKSALGDEA